LNTVAFYRIYCNTYCYINSDYLAISIYDNLIADRVAKLGTLTTLFGDKIFLTTPSPAIFLWFPRRNWLFPVSSAVNCHDFTATVTAFSCPLNLCRIKWKENSSCNACGHPLQDLTHLLLDCPASETLWHTIFGTSSSIFYLSGPDLKS